MRTQLLTAAGVLLVAGSIAASQLHLGQTSVQVYLPKSALTQQLDRLESGETSGPPEAPAGLHLRIPAIGVDAPVDRLGVDSAGRMQAPTAWEDVGWFDQGPAPGQAGVALVLGHVDSHTGPAVFFRLHDLQPGDEVLVEGPQPARFKVSRLTNFPESAAPVDQLFVNSGPPRLVLLTCSGDFNRATQRYDDRLMVTADSY